MLHELRCEACRAGAAGALTNQQLQELLFELDGWRIVTRGSVPQLEKTFQFSNFKKAWSFSERVANLADQQNHHPSILAEWGKVTVTWWTHSLHGLHKNDFICAAKCDQLYHVGD